MEQLNVTVLGRDVGQHGGKHGSRGGGVDQLIESDAVAHDLATGQHDRLRQLQDLPRRHGLGSYRGDGVAEIQHEQDKEIQSQADADQKIGPGPAVQLTDQVGAEKGQRIGQDADRQRHRAKLDEAGDADDIEQGHGAEEGTREHQEDPFPAFPYHRQGGHLRLPSGPGWRAAPRR